MILYTAFLSPNSLKSILELRILGSLFGHSFTTLKSFLTALSWDRKSANKITEAYLGHGQTNMVELSAKIVNSFIRIIAVWLNHRYVSD